MTRREALAFVRKKGVVVEAARGPLPSLAEEIAGEPFAGSWWGHPKGREIFRLTRAVRDSSDVLVSCLVKGKITYVHRRLWPALVRAARYFDRDALAAIREVHTAGGKHVIERVPYPKWVPAEVKLAASAIDLAEAEATLRELGLLPAR
jgi:hypothetical protein